MTRSDPQLSWLIPSEPAPPDGPEKVRLIWRQRQRRTRSLVGAAAVACVLLGLSAVMWSQSAPKGSRVTTTPSPLPCPASRSSFTPPPHLSGDRLTATFIPALARAVIPSSPAGPIHPTNDDPTLRYSFPSPAGFIQVSRRLVAPGTDLAAGLSDPSPVKVKGHQGVRGSLPATIAGPAQSVIAWFEQPDIVITVLTGEVTAADALATANGIRYTPGTEVTDPAVHPASLISREQAINVAGQATSTQTWLAARTEVWNLAESLDVHGQAPTGAFDADSSGPPDWVVAQRGRFPEGTWRVSVINAETGQLKSESAGPGDLPGWIQQLVDHSATTC